MVFVASAGVDRSGRMVSAVQVGGHAYGITVLLNGHACDIIDGTCRLVLSSVVAGVIVVGLVSFNP